MEVSKEDLIAQCTADIKHVASFIEKYLGLANLHNSNFIVCKYWEQIPEAMKRKLEAHPGDHMSALLLKENWSTQVEGESGNILWKSNCGSLPREMVDGELQPSDPDQPLTWHHSQLPSFMSEAASCHLDHRGFTKKCEEIYGSIYSANTQETEPFINHAMGEKKSHEVELMAATCSQLANTHNIKHIADLGSGKGYLATTLAMQYGYKVIGIDSQEGNTHGAIQRKQRLEKQYSGLVRREQEKAAISADDSKHGRRRVAKEKRRLSQSSAEESQTRLTAAFTALTAYIGPEDDLQKYVADEFPDSQQCMLTGLHTCGNLAVSMAKLFLRSPSCRAMINVGCCYHQVDEMYSASPFKSQVLSTPHFPMSSVLINMKFRLGRNCRMLSMQAMEKASELGIGGVFPVGSGQISVLEGVTAADTVGYSRILEKGLDCR